MLSGKMLNMSKSPRHCCLARLTTRRKALSMSLWSAHELPIFSSRKLLPALQLIQAGIGRPPNAGTLLSSLPLHELIINERVLSELDGIQQLSDFVNYLLKGEEEQGGINSCVTPELREVFFFLKQSMYLFTFCWSSKQSV